MRKSKFTPEQILQALRVIRTAGHPRAVTAADIARTSEQNRRAAQRMWKSERFPAFSTFMVDPLGRLWMEDYVPPNDRGPNDPNVWTVFDPMGRMIGRLDMPRRHQGRLAMVVEFGADELQWTYQDNDGFTYLSFRRIEPVRP